MSPRALALEIWTAALAAGDVTPLVQRALASPEIATALASARRVIVLGCGKASAAMAAAAEEALGDRIAIGFVVVKDGYRAPTRRVEIAEAGHPVPDARGEAAASRLVALAAEARADDLVLLLVSGGGSALTPAPAPPVTLAEKQALTRGLLRAGATINELNAVRKHLSRFKGGQLARSAAPARVLTLALSDVIGDPLDVIASGPTAPDVSTFGEALGVLERRQVRATAPASVVARLEAGARGEIPETPKPGDPVFQRVTNVVIGNNALVVDAAAARGRALGLAPAILTRQLEGEAREVARSFVTRAQQLAPGGCLVDGGETTVTVRGSGRGGRCQEFALAAAMAMEGIDDLAVLAAGTDGTDGPTDAAGGIADGGTIGRGRARGLDPAASLADNDAFGFLHAAGDLVVTGPTHTNLLDVYIALRAPLPRE
ncbi:MAG: glycerate kinase [Candidatus Rokubacteria bacterium]|nr:glycerate kinase [Candidatus Rokubacteria bacterium]